MNTLADKSQGNKSQSVANGVSEKQTSSESDFQFLDNRAQTVAQRKLQEKANNSPQVKQAAQSQLMADDHSVQQQNPLQNKLNNTGLSDDFKTEMLAPVAQRQVIQREDWDLKDLDDKDSQQKNPLNSMSKSLFDEAAKKLGSEGLARFGSVASRLNAVKTALIQKDSGELIKALTDLNRQFKSGTPPSTYVNQRLQELKENSQAAMNTMAAYHNVRATGNDAPKDDDLIAYMRAYILSAKDAYVSRDYRKADALLMDNKEAIKYGFYVDNKGGKTNKRNYIWFSDSTDLLKQSMPELEKAMAMHEKGNERIILPYIIPKKQGESEDYLDYPELAEKAIPVYLEEWMHKFQKRMREEQNISEKIDEGGGTGAFWSQNTADFQVHANNKFGVKNAKNEIMVYNEIDILSAFHDWGFPVEELGTVGGEVPRYKGREQYWQWLKGTEG